MRKILEERLENAINDYHNCYGDIDNFPFCEGHISQGKIEAYQDCLNLLPQPRTEQEILKDFEALGYEVVVNNEEELDLRYQTVDIWCGIRIYKYITSYEPYLITKATKRPVELNMQEHKLLNELFSVWRWI